MLCMTPQPQGQIRLSGSMFSSVRGNENAYGARHLAKQVGNLAEWKKTVSLLESIPLDKEDEKRCIEAAIYSFRTFEINYEKASGEQ